MESLTSGPASGPISGSVGLKKPLPAEQTPYPIPPLIDLSQEPNSLSNGRVGPPPDGDNEAPWERSVPPSRRSVYTKVLIVVGFGMLFAVLSLAIRQPPADGPTATLADTVMEDPLLVTKAPTGPGPTMMSSEAREAPPTTLNPNAIFVGANTGSDDNAGTDIGSPLFSLQAALDRVEPGETIYLLDGRYSEQEEPGNFHYLVRRGGTADAWVRIENAPGHAPEIVATNGNGIEVQSDYVEVVGLRVRGEGFDPEGNPWGNGILIRNSHHVHLVGNEISDMPSSGVSAVESSNLAIMNNDVHDNAFWNTAQGSGISFWHSRDQGEPPDADGYHDRIIGNRVYRNENKVKSIWHNYEVISDGNGIIIDEGTDTGYNGRILVLNNEIFDNGGRAVLVYQSVNVDIFFNTTYRNARTKDLLGGPTEMSASEARNIRFINNLVWPREGSAAFRARETNNYESAGNLVISSDDPGPIGDTDTITTTPPGLINPSIDESIADFRLEPGNTASGSAVTVSPSVKFDRDGNDRSQQPPTVGAYILP